MIINQLLGKRFEIIITSEQDVQSLKELYMRCPFACVYAVPEMVTATSVMKMMLNGKFDIYVMIDYPDGLMHSTAKFHGLTADVFLCDGIDVILSKVDIIDNKNEITEIYNFINTLIDPHIKRCLTLGCSRFDDEYIEELIEFINTKPTTKLKTEIQPKSTKRRITFNDHQHTWELLMDKTNIPVTLVGNINKKLCYEIGGCKFGVSPNQANQILTQLLKND